MQLMKRNAIPNDPMYLMENTSTPEPWNKSPMFKQHGSDAEAVSFRGKEYNVTIKFSYFKPEAGKG